MKLSSSLLRGVGSVSSLLGLSNVSLFDTHLHSLEFSVLGYNKLILQHAPNSQQERLSLQWNPSYEPVYLLYPIGVDLRNTFLSLERNYDIASSIL